MRTPSKVISFRVSQADYARLEREAYLSENASTVTEYVRKLLESRHKESENQAADEATLAMEVACLKDEVRELREDLSVAVKALLITKGSEAVTTPEQADQWVKQNLKHVA